MPLNVSFQLGWLTMDNASNNDTLMASLERELNARGISFDRVENRIRYVRYLVRIFYLCKDNLDVSLTS